MAMTKREFALRLLFWLLPWPISKILPRSLRIYYFGPSGGPPPGFYDYFGIPQWFWPDVPPYDDFIEDPPDEEPPWWPPVIPPDEVPPVIPPDEVPPVIPPDIPPYYDFIQDPPSEPPPWFPVDPYNPPPPDQFPDLPDGPVNPQDPYIPGPGPGPSPPLPDNFHPYFDNSFWEPKGNGGDRAVWDAVNEHWDSVLSGAIHVIELVPIGTWYVGSRYQVSRITFTVHDSVDFYIVDSEELLLLHEDPAYSEVYIKLDFYRGNDIGFIRFWAADDTPFSVTNIKFL